MGRKESNQTNKTAEDKHQIQVNMIKNYHSHRLNRSAFVTWRKWHNNVCILILNAPIATKVVCFTRLLKCLRSLYDKQCGPRSDCAIGEVCSESILFASLLNSSVMLGNYLQQTTSADDIFRCIFSWRFKD